MVCVKVLLSLLPPDLLDRLALEHDVDAKNQIRLPGSTVFVCLLNGLLNHADLTLRLLEDLYQKIFQPQTGHTTDHSTFGKRLASIKPDYFAALYAYLHQQLAPQARPGEAKALRLRFIDATVVALSSKLLGFGISQGTRNGKASHRTVKSVLELHQDGLPRLLHICREQAEANDSVALGQPMQEHTQPGDLWVFDQGMHSRERLRSLAEAGAFFLTPHSTQGVRVLRTLWQSPAETPTAAPGEGEASCVLVRAERTVFENAQTTRRQAQQWAAMPLVLVHSLRFDARTRQWKPLVLMTNLPASTDGLRAGPYTFGQLAELYRRRWDIETLFKFLKQHLGYSHLTSRSENGIQVMIYMSLIAALLLIWYQRQTGIARGWRSVKFWFADDVRQWTQQLLEQALAASLPGAQPDTG